MKKCHKVKESKGKDLMKSLNNKLMIYEAVWVTNRETGKISKQI